MSLQYNEIYMFVPFRIEK